MNEKQRDRYWLWFAIAIPVVTFLLLLCTWPAQALPAYDRYDPTVPDERAVLAVHGGGWINGSKASMQQVCEEIVVPLGITCFAADYTLSETAPYPQANHDLTAMVNHIRDDLGFTQVAGIGSSAGGTLVGWLATRGHLDVAIMWSAPTDLTTLEDWGDPPRIATYAPTAPKRTQASPALNVDAQMPPTLLVHALDDAVIPYSQATGMKAALAAYGIPRRLEPIAGSAHGLAMFDAAEAETVEWLETYL